MPVLRMLTVVTLVSLPLAGAAQEAGPKESPGSANVQYPELVEVIQDFSKRTGRKFIIDPRTRANAVLVGIDPGNITYEQLLATLSVNYFATVTQGDVIIVVPDATARQLPTPVYTDLQFKAADDEWVTLLLTPRKACAPQLVPILRPLMPQAAHLAADLKSGSLVITDRAANARRIANLVDRLDKAANGKPGCEPEKSGS